MPGHLCLLIVLHDRLTNILKFCTLRENSSYENLSSFDSSIKDPSESWIKGIMDMWTTLHQSNYFTAI